MANVGPGVWFLRDNSQISTALFTAAATSGVMTVSAITSGNIFVGGTYQIGATNFTVTGFTSGVNGQIGVYTISGSTTFGSGAVVGATTATRGTVGWSAASAWAASASVAAGVLRRQAAIGCVITATIATTVLTVVSAIGGTVAPGMSLVVPGGTNTTITAYGTGTGGAGTYTIANSQTVSSTTDMAGTLTYGNERVFACIVAGTTGSTEPTWVLTKGAKTTDNTATWMEVTGQPGVNGDTTDSPTWLQNKNTTVTLGLIIYDSVSASLQIVTTAGTTGNGTQPTFSATAGVTTSDNTVTWTSLGLASNFGSWAAPFARMQAATATNWATGLVKLFGAADHSEQQAGAIAISAAGGISVISIPTGTIPPTTVQSGASVTTTGNNNLAINLGGSSFTYFSGLTFSAGSGAVGAIITMGLGGNVGLSHFDFCTFIKNGTVGNTLSFEAGNYTNCSFQVGSTSDIIQFLYRCFVSALSFLGSTIPVNGVFSTTGLLTVTGSDLSPLGTNKLFIAASSGSTFNIFQCKVAAGAVYFTPGLSGAKLSAVNVDSAGTNYTITLMDDFGTLTQETVIIRSGGASSGSEKIVSTTSTLWQFPFQDTLSIYNTITGTNRIVNVFGIYNNATVPNNDQQWISVAYLGSASGPLGSFANNTKANALAAGTALPQDFATLTGASISGNTLSFSSAVGNVAAGQSVLNGTTVVGVITAGSGTSWTVSGAVATSSTTLTTQSLWNSLATARANSTTYAVGNEISVPGSNFVWACISGSGSSAASQPAGYASAVMGGTVTDGGYVFRAEQQFINTVTLSSPQPAQQGTVYVTVNQGLASATMRVDPRPVLG